MQLITKGSHVLVIIFTVEFGLFAVVRYAVMYSRLLIYKQVTIFQKRYELEG